MKINFTNTERMKMMKRKLGILLMAATLLFAGCQGDAPIDALTPTKGLEGTETVQPGSKEELTENPDETKAPDTTKAAEPTTTPEPEEVEPKLYERLAAWDDFYKEYECYYTAIQIEDMFLHPGMMGSELAEAIAASEDTLIAPVAAGKLMEPGMQTLKIYRNEVPWFDACVHNYTDDLLPLGECIVSLFVPCDAVMDYCRFFDGTYTMESIRGITYQEFDNFKASMEKLGYSTEKKGSEWNMKGTEAFCPASLSESVLYWTNQKLFVKMKIDADTGTVSTMDISYGTGECELYTKSIPDNYDWGGETVAEQLIQQLYAAGFSSSEAEETIEPVCVYSGRLDDDYIVLYQLQGTDKQISYVVYSKRDMKLNFLNELIVSKGYTTDFWKIEGSCTDAFKKMDEVNPGRKLIYEYKTDYKGLVKEDYKISLGGKFLTLPATPNEVLEFFSVAGAWFLEGGLDNVLDVGEIDSNGRVLLSDGRTSLAHLTIENWNDYTCNIMEGTVTGVMVYSNSGCIFPLGYQFGEPFDLEKTIQQIGAYDNTFVMEGNAPVPDYTIYYWNYENEAGEIWKYGVTVYKDTGKTGDVQIGYWKE